MTVRTPVLESRQALLAGIGTAGLWSTNGAGVMAAH
jgi:hypothetical protein